MTTTMHENSAACTPFDADSVLKSLREAGVTEIDDLLLHWAQRRQLQPDEAAKTQPEFERSLRDRTMALERALHVRDIERLVPTAKGLIIGGVRYVALAPSKLEILLMSGWATVNRPLFRARGGHGGETVDVLGQRIGLVGGSTSLAASRVIAQHSVTQSEADAAKTMATARALAPSASHVGRVMKALGAGIEAQRELVEEAIRVDELAAQRLPAAGDVASVVWSLDGIMVRMKDAPNTPGADRHADTPKGHREAASATVALFDAKGNRLHTISIARMPESKKVTLQSQLQAELSYIIDLYPKAKLLAVADAAQENWRIIGQIERALGIRSIRAVDYFHAKDHLVEGLKQSRASDADISHWKEVLLTEPGGADACLAELARRRQFGGVANCPERSRKLDSEITYFNNNAKQMNYPALRAQQLAVGSGVQEAACKSLVADRLKRSGMSWLDEGGQAVLTFRSYDKSDRFDLAWNRIEPRFRQSYDQVEVDPSDARKMPSWSQQAAA